MPSRLSLLIPVRKHELICARGVPELKSVGVACVKAFVAMVMGGLSSIPGAVACALLLGVSESVATQFFSDGWKALVSYSFLLLTLWFFPNGIFGTQKEKM